MEIYLKHRERKQFVCIQPKDTGSCELEIYESMMSRDYDISYSIYEDDTVDARLSWFNSQKETVGYNGNYLSITTWQKSNKAEFMEAYKNAKNTIKTFADKLIMK
jgi:hypothetical protein